MSVNNSMSYRACPSRRCRRGGSGSFLRTFQNCMHQSKIDHPIFWRKDKIIRTYSLEIKSACPENYSANSFKLEKSIGRLQNDLQLNFGDDRSPWIANSIKKNFHPYFFEISADSIYLGLKCVPNQHIYSNCVVFTPIFLIQTL